VADVLTTPERLFIAAPISSKAREELRRRLPDVLPGRPVQPDKWHFTLRFLGNTPAQQRDRLVGELRSVNLGKPFRIELGGLGAFPSPSRARVLWVGVTHGADQLVRLAKVVESGVQEAGFPAEPRPFRSHLTLSRLDPPTDVRRLLEIAPAAKVSLNVDEIVLFRSHLGKAGARHDIVESFPLV
jgi:2'-5' RNA ligase